MHSSERGISRRRSYVPLREKVLERPKFSWKKIYDPQDEVLEVWNKMFVVCCILAVSSDPLLLYISYLDNKEICMDLELDVAIIATMLRTILDAFYCVRIFFQYRTAFVAPSSREFGRRELVTNSAQIAKHYFGGLFILDLLSILPLPQVVIWSNFNTNRDVLRTKEALLLIVLLQYFPRFLRILPLATEFKNSVGVFVQSPFYGVICYLSLFVLFSHIFGSFWYLLALQRNAVCWEKACAVSDICKKSYLYCSINDKLSYVPSQWANISASYVKNACSVENDGSLSLDVVKYGIYKQALESDIFSKDNFFSKYIFCMWWGLQNLSTLGQGLEPIMNPGEICFTVSVAVFGLVFFGLMIGNVQIYLQSLTVRIDQTRLQRRNAEEWMQHRFVPQNLRERFRCYERYRWIETRGVDEESLVQSLSSDLKKDIKRHVCQPLVQRVPLFVTADERLLDAIYERFKPNFYMENTCIMRQGDPVEEILLIVRGQLQSATTNGWGSGFYKLSVLKEGDLCGVDLLTWSLEPASGSTLPLSTETVQALTVVEAFALSAEDIKFLSCQFSRQFHLIFRFYSQQWRTWAVCYIQSAWRRYTTRRKISGLLVH